jgi:hypothetical protein
MTKAMIHMDLAELAALAETWAARVEDAKARGDADLIAGCRRNLRAVRAEITLRHS